MSLPIFRKLESDLGVVKSISVPLQLAGQTIFTPEGIIKDILVQVDKFAFFVNFIVCRHEGEQKGASTSREAIPLQVRSILDIY